MDTRHRPFHPRALEGAVEGFTAFARATLVGAIVAPLTPDPVFVVALGLAGFLPGMLVATLMSGLEVDPSQGPPLSTGLRSVLRRFSAGRWTLLVDAIELVALGVLVWMYPHRCRDLLLAWNAIAVAMLVLTLFWVTHRRLLEHWRRRSDDAPRHGVAGKGDV